MKANKITFVAMMAVLAALVFVGCANPVAPDPIPEPVKVYLTGSAMFTRVDAAGTLAYADIYQWDGEGTMYTGSNVEVTFDATYGTEWTIQVGGNTYLNDANIGPIFVNSDPSSDLDFEFVIQDVTGIVGNNIHGGFESFTDMNPTYVGSNTITAMGGSLQTWTRM
jgi:hypothetical protein